MYDKYLELLEHSSGCIEPCTIKNCDKAKQLLRHHRICAKKIQGGCVICKRAGTLFILHARQCTLEHCNVPHCHNIRNHLKYNTY
jgi:E1A/CREB-binding protein